MPESILDEFRIFFTQLRVGFLKHTDQHAHEPKTKGGAVNMEKRQQSQNTVSVDRSRNAKVQHQVKKIKKINKYL